MHSHNFADGDKDLKDGTKIGLPPVVWF